MRNATPVVNMSRTTIHYDGKKQKSRRRIKTTPLQILDHALPYLLLCVSSQDYPRCHAIGIRGAAGLEEARFDHVSVGVLDDPLHALRLDLEAQIRWWTAAAHPAALCVYNCNCSTLIVFSPPPLRKLSISELLILTITLSLTCNSSKEILVTFCVAKSQ